MSQHAFHASHTDGTNGGKGQGKDIGKTTEGDVKGGLIIWKAAIYEQSPGLKQIETEAAFPTGLAKRRPMSLAAGKQKHHVVTYGFAGRGEVCRGDDRTRPASRVSLGHHIPAGSAMGRQ